MASSPSRRPCFPRPRIPWPLLLVLAAGLLIPSAHATKGTEVVQIPQETLMVDNSVPILVNGKWVWVAEDAPELRRRRSGDDDEEEEENGESKTKGGDDDNEDATSTITMTPKETDEDGEEEEQSITSTSTASTHSPLPSAFDTNMDYNFTSNGGQSCPRFLNDLLMSDTFKSCYPISMMLQTSKSFFDATKELQSIVTVLDATCAADIDFCTTYLHDQAAALTSPDNCGQEYDELQPDVRRVHLGLTSFNVLYKATCLRQDGTYCFANAITNASTPVNAYVYFLPLNMPLPGSAAPACGVCLRDTMAIYQAATATRSLAIADTYEGAAGRMNAVCGGQFANETLPEAVDGGAGGRVAPGVVFMTAAVVFLSWVV